MPFPLDFLYQPHFPNVEQTYFSTILPQRGTSGGISEAKSARGNHHYYHHKHNDGNADNQNLYHSYHNHNADNHNHIHHHHHQYLEQESKEHLAPGQRLHPNGPPGQNTNKNCKLRIKKNCKLKNKNYCKLEIQK